MLTSSLRPVLLLCIAGAMSVHAQQRSTSLIQPLRDDGILLSTDKPVYFPDDTLRLSIQREDSGGTVKATPIIAIEGMALTPEGPGAYVAVIPQTVAPGSYHILLRMADGKGQRILYETGHSVEVEEHQAVEQLRSYVSIEPLDGSSDPQNAITVDDAQIRALHLVFTRDSIRTRMGPQFVTMRTTVQLRDGTTAQTFERRVVTFRSRGEQRLDRAMFNQYRTAYGAYAGISTEELDEVRLPLDSLPSWAIIRVHIEPDYTIKIGSYDRSNSITRYYRVRGPAVEAGFSLGIPKVLYDTRARDTTEYGNTSALVRFYYVNVQSGNRFPVSLGLGTFGGNSPLDVSAGRGGFALSGLLDLVGLTQLRELGIVKSVNAGLECALFIPIARKSRVLIDVQVGFSL